MKYFNCKMNENKKMQSKKMGAVTIKIVLEHEIMWR